MKKAKMKNKIKKSKSNHYHFNSVPVSTHDFIQIGLAQIENIFGKVLGLFHGRLPFIWPRFTMFLFLQWTSGLMVTPNNFLS